MSQSRSEMHTCAVLALHRHPTAQACLTKSVISHALMCSSITQQTWSELMSHDMLAPHYMIFVMLCSCICQLFKHRLEQKTLQLLAMHWQPVYQP